MKRQPYPVAQLTGGLDVSVDAVFLVDKSSPYLRNVRFDKGLIKKGLGWVAFGTVNALGVEESASCKDSATVKVRDNVLLEDVLTLWDSATVTLP